MYVIFIFLGEQTEGIAVKASFARERISGAAGDLEGRQKKKTDGALEKDAGKKCFRHGVFNTPCLKGVDEEVAQI